MCTYRTIPRGGHLKNSERIYIYTFENVNEVNESVDGNPGEKAIAAFGTMLVSFPINDPLNEEILEILNAVRGKFKTVVALLGMHHEYNPQETKLSLNF